MLFCGGSGFNRCDFARWGSVSGLNYFTIDIYVSAANVAFYFVFI